ncbi:MAG: signal peptidase I [Erysipelotrichaceae bacterium]|nr:signal peptidase I [Erysipelotrichaceae bacterium]
MKNWKDTLKELLQTVVTSVVIVFLLTTFILIPVRVEGRSMYPLLKEGDIGLSFILGRHFGLERFDIVVLRSERLSYPIVKRIIGLPGESVSFRDNTLYINGEAVAEGFLAEDVITADLDIQLQEDEYFVMGDNRGVSRDSRYYGPFSAAEILSKDILVLWPFTEAGLK